MILVGDWAPGTKNIDWTLGNSTILANLEGPILSLDHGLSPLAKAGPNLYSTSLPPRGRPFVFALANNHIMDYGMEGLGETHASLNRSGFKATGAGKNIVDARRPLIIEEGNSRIAIISCCEAQFGVARLSSAGVAEIGPWIFSLIAELKKSVTAIIISVHAAVEDSPWPSPRFQELYRSFIDAGVAIVHGHHAHVPQGIEGYRDGLILYGLGNFAVDPDIWRDTPNALWSIGIDIDCSTKPVSFRLLTFEIRKTAESKISVEESTREARGHHLDFLNACNRPLTDALLLEALWQETSLRCYFHHTAGYLKFPDGLKDSPSGLRFDVGLNRIKKLFSSRNGSGRKGRSSRGDYLFWYHVFACESHRDSVATALGLLSGEIKDLRTPESGRLADEMMPWSRGVVPI